jgi:isoleucyl-tRNA synthetase
MLLDGNSFAQTQGVDWAEVLIVGSAEAVEGTPEPARASDLPHAVSVLAEVERTADAKCGRCWRLLPEVKADGGLCNRCSEVING